jgi:septal ring factor EnvC (AmiA/AmiB activator)
VDKFLEILGTAGYPSGFVGIVLMLLFWVRKQESGIRTDINGSLQRLTTDIEAKNAELREAETEIDTLRKERRDAEDREDRQRRRADAADAKAEDLQAKLTAIEEQLRAIKARLEENNHE